MKKEFNEPELKVVVLQINDVITTSGDYNPWDEDEGDRV